MALALTPTSVLLIFVLRRLGGWGKTWAAVIMFCYGPAMFVAIWWAGGAEERAFWPLLLAGAGCGLMTAISWRFLFPYYQRKGWG
jgi:hypothetical protein